MPHRVRQFLEAGRRPTAADRELAERWLSQALLALFLAQHPRDVVHGAECARWLLARGYDDRDLVSAALVHDVGKGWQRPGDRVVYVITAAARLAPAIASGDSRFDLRRAVARSLAHAASGAAALAAAGATPRMVQLTRNHHSKANGDVMLAALQQADAAT
jgi:hypothetical protein